MATISIPKWRQESDVLLHVALEDNGVSVDWTSLSDIKAFFYSDVQKRIAGKCSVRINSSDSKLLDVTYLGIQPQYLGINSLVVRCTYDGRQKTYDLPVGDFVPRTALATGVTVMTDPELNVTIRVQEVSTSLLDNAIAAALDAAEHAEEAAAAAEGVVSQAQADWDQTDETAPDYIKNKPDIESADLFIAKYGVTTYAEISAATYNKTIFLDRYGQVFTFIRTDVIRGHCFAAFGGAIMSSSGQEDAALYGELCYVTRGDVWSHTTYTLLGDKDIVTSLDAQSTDQQIPGAKTVYDALGLKYEKPSGGIPDADLAAAIQATLAKADSAVQPAELDDITDLIPAAASEQNQLADKNFVNSSVATNTANYISDNGDPFTSLADLEAYSGTLTNNDYAFVVGTDSAGNTTYTRYKYNATTQTWAEEYVLNNSSFTAAQWDAISSGITAGKVDKLDGIASGAQVNVIETVKVNGTALTPSNKAVDIPVPAAQVNADWNASSGVEQILNKPTIPTVPTISTNIQTDKASNTKTASPKAVYDEVHPAVGSSQPAGGMLPNVFYNLGTLSGNTTFAFAAASDANIMNEWMFQFTTPSTAPTITWPAAITGWLGGSTPTINASKTYQVSVVNGLGVIAEF